MLPRATTEVGEIGLHSASRDFFNGQLSHQAYAVENFADSFSTGTGLGGRAERRSSLLLSHSLGCSASRVSSGCIRGNTCALAALMRSRRSARACSDRKHHM